VAKGLEQIVSWGFLIAVALGSWLIIYPEIDFLSPLVNPLIFNRISAININGYDLCPLVGCKTAENAIRSWVTLSQCGFKLCYTWEDLCLDIFTPNSCGLYNLLIILMI
jgi:hypothetical protein